jgi:hypothetical protein
MHDENHHKIGEEEGKHSADKLTHSSRQKSSEFILESVQINTL